MVFYSSTIEMMHGPINIRFVIIIPFPLQHEFGPLLYYKYITFSLIFIVAVQKVKVVNNIQFQNYSLLHFDTV